MLRLKHIFLLILLLHLLKVTFQLPIINRLQRWRMPQFVCWSRLLPAVLVVWTHNIHLLPTLRRQIHHHFLPRIRSLCLPLQNLPTILWIYQQIWIVLMQRSFDRNQLFIWINSPFRIYPVQSLLMIKHKKTWIVMEHHVTRSQKTSLFNKQWNILIRSGLGLLRNYFSYLLFCFTYLIKQTAKLVESINLSLSKNMHSIWKARDSLCESHDFLNCLFLELEFLLCCCNLNSLFWIQMV